MKFILIVLFLLPALICTGQRKVYFCATTGSDANPGTITAPFATWEKLGSVLQAGDSGFILDGTYRVTHSNTNRVQISNRKGTATSRIFIGAYPGAKPVLNCDNKNVAEAIGLMVDNCNYLHIKGLKITGVKQAGGTPVGMMLYQSDYNIVELCEITYIGGYGFYLQGPQNPGGDGSDFNLIKNVDVFHCADSDGGTANGFNITGGDLSKENVFDGCRAGWISDDGFDFFNCNGLVTIINCWSFRNGYKLVNGVSVKITGSNQDIGGGYKLGPNNDRPNTSPIGITRIVINSLAVNNALNGVDQNSGNDNYPTVRLINITSVNNGDRDFSFGSGGINSVPHDIQRCLGSVIWGPDIQKPNNAWTTGPTVSQNDFKLFSDEGLAGPRQGDGSLPLLNNYILKTTSPLAVKGWGYQYGAGGVVVPPPPPPPPPSNQINTLFAVADGGFRYYVAQDFGTPADDNANKTRSLLRIYENGVELTPAHATHVDIGNIGKGRFSHWSDGTETLLYLSATDNSNPASNGKTYTFSLGTVVTPPPEIKINATVILYGANMTRQVVTYFVKKADGFYYDSGGVKRDVFIYKGTDGKWMYRGADGKWYILF